MLPPRITILHVAIACLTGLLIGYSLCFIGALLAVVQQSLEFCYPCPGGDYSHHGLSQCTCFEKSFAVSSVSLTAVAGGLSCGFIADAVGRRRALMLLDLFFAGGALLMALSSVGTKSLFFAGRMLTGLGVGGGAAASAYLLEISPPALRGCLVELNELALGTGCVLAGVTSWLMGDEHWRWTVEVIVLIAAVQFLCIALLLHESPSWLATKGRAEEAQAAAAALGLAPPAELAEEPPAKLPEMQSLPLQRSDRRAVLLSMGCGVGHAATATNTVLYFSRNILERAGVDHSLMCTVLIDAVKFFGILTCVLTVELVGRRRLLIVGSTGIVIGHAAMAVSFAVAKNWIAVATLPCFIYCWNISWSGLMLVVASELLPTRLRGAGLGGVYSAYWLISGLEEQTLGKAFRTLTPPGTFSFYGALSLCTLLFAVLCLPETRPERASSVAREESEEETETSRNSSSSMVSSEVED